MSIDFFVIVSNQGVRNINAHAWKRRLTLIFQEKPAFTESEPDVATAQGSSFGEPSPFSLKKYRGATYSMFPELGEHDKIRGNSEHLTCEATPRSTS